MKVSWDDCSQYLGKSNMFRTTNQRDVSATERCFAARALVIGGMGSLTFACHQKLGFHQKTWW